MLFNSFEFLIFFPITIIIGNLLKNRWQRLFFYLRAIISIWLGNQAPSNAMPAKLQALDTGLIPFSAITRSTPMYPFCFFDRSGLLCREID